MEFRAEYKADIGVIIGRFQVHHPHKEHLNLIKTVISKHKKTIIILGSTPGVLVSRHNPLDYYTRMLMLKDLFPDVMFAPVYDEPTDIGWSNTIDKKIIELVGDQPTVLLYGSRDSFIPYYKGRFNTIELPSSNRFSGTSIRESISDITRASADFRHGIIYGVYSRYPVAYPTVDIIVHNPTNNKVLLGHKTKDGKNVLRFPGGFVSPDKDNSFEAAAKRELLEEVGPISVDDWKYLGSCKVDDWRYRRERDKIFTSLFTCTYMFGHAEASDDLDACEWAELNDSRLVPTHKPLMDMFLTYLKKE